MSPEICAAMARYNRWMNRKVYGASARLTDEERKRDRGAFFKSIHGTLNHLLLADRVWLGRLTGVESPPGFMAPGIRTLDQELFADFAELQAARESVDAEIDAFAKSLTREAIDDEPLRYTRAGEQREHPRWWAVMQLFNHGTHHRGQITTLLMQAGQDPGSTDFLAMLVEEQQKTK